MTTKIIGTGSYVPAQIVTNDDLSKIVETNDQWIRSRTGIGERRIATDDSTSDMAAKAAARAIDKTFSALRVDRECGSKNIVCQITYNQIVQIQSQIGRASCRERVFRAV